MSLKYFHLSTWKYTRQIKGCGLYSTLTNVVFSTNILITKHVKSGNLVEARYLFDQMTHRTVVSWNTMISGYSKWGRYDEAIALASLMHHCNVKLNESSFSTLLSVCAHSGSLSVGNQVHSLLLKSGFANYELVGSSLMNFYSCCCKIEEAKLVFDELHDENELLWSLMLSGYVRCNMMGEALDIFHEMPIRDVVAWTILISGYAKIENGSLRALELFKWMRSLGTLPNQFTLDCVIRTCAELRVLHQGKVVHGLCIKCGYDFDGSINGALVELYCNCDAIDDAIRVYDKIEEPCLNISNSLINGLVSTGQIKKAELVFLGLKETNSVSVNMMIKGYAMSGQAEKSKRLFEQLSPKTITSSNTMISVFSRNGELGKALKIFNETKGEGDSVTWNSIRSTFSVLFHACACLGFLQQGQLLHGNLTKTPFQSNVYVGTSLIDMYSKCGNLTDAQRSFVNISLPNVAAWTALINGYAYHGLGSEAISLFESMLVQGVSPNAATFVSILSACGHAGLVDQGLAIFHSMKQCYSVKLTIEHYTCVVNLLGRAGHLKEAEEFVKRVPIETDVMIWETLLNACWFWKDIKIGQRAARKLPSLSPNSVSAFVVLSNIYAVQGRWGHKVNVRNRLQSLKLRKDPGCSWIELNNNIHVFSVEDKGHPYSDVIFETVKHIAAAINSFTPMGCLYYSIGE